MSIQPLLDSIPFVAKTGVHCEDYAPGRVVLSLVPDQSNMNHAATFHAGALFTLAETAGAAACATHPMLSTYQLLARGSNIRFRKGARGSVTAHCHVTTEMARTVDWGVSTTRKADLEVPVQILDGQGDTIAEFVAIYQFRRTT